MISRRQCVWSRELHICYAHLLSKERPRIHRLIFWSGLTRQERAEFFQLLQAHLLITPDIALEHLSPNAPVGIPVTLAAAPALLFQQIDLSLATLKREGAMLPKLGQREASRLDQLRAC